MHDANLYVGLIEQQDVEDAFIQTYWARAKDFGGAIELMLEAARANGLETPDVKEIDPYNIQNLTAEVKPSREARVFWNPTRYRFPPEGAFQIPYGVIPSCIEEDGDCASDITEGYTTYTGENGLIRIELNVERSGLVSLYERLLCQCNNYKVFWYLLHDHWDEKDDAFLINESLNSPAKIMRHLQENELDSVLNGLVTLTSYRAEGDTNFNISDHKRIIITTYAPDVAAECRAVLTKLEYPEAEDLVSIDYRIHHWHYRHPNSRSREELIRHLGSIGFSDWKPGA